MSESDITSSAAIARSSIDRVVDELGISALGDLASDFDIFATLDSFAIVELLMTTEAQLEEVTGVYVPLADEKIFDASQSPLRSFNGWVDFIEERRRNA